MPSTEAFTQRERRAIIKYFKQGLESPDIAPLFDASESGVRRVYQQYREEGRDKPAFENCGRKPACDDEQKQQIIAIVRTYGRSMQGDRCIGSAPGGHWKTMTGVAAIRLDGLTAGATMAHAMDGDCFLVYVTHALLPALRGGDVVVMDNLPGHKLGRVRELIESVVAKLLYLPPYSPDFNSIEMIWSKVKRMLRSTAARTIDTLHEAFAAAFDAVTLSDIQKLLSALRVHAMTFCAPL